MVSSSLSAKFAMLQEFQRSKMGEPGRSLILMMESPSGGMTRITSPFCKTRIKEGQSPHSGMKHKAIDASVVVVECNATLMSFVATKPRGRPGSVSARMDPIVYPFRLPHSSATFGSTSNAPTPTVSSNKAAAIDAHVDAAAARMALRALAGAGRTLRALRVRATIKQPAKSGSASPPPPLPCDPRVTTTALPTDVLRLIFDHIALRPRLLVLARVCRRWQKAVYLSVHTIPLPLRYSGPFDRFPNPTACDFSGDDHVPETWTPEQRARLRSVRFELSALSVLERAGLSSLTSLEVYLAKPVLPALPELVRANAASLTHLSVAPRLEGLWLRTEHLPPMPESLPCLCSLVNGSSAQTMRGPWSASRPCYRSSRTWRSPTWIRRTSSWRCRSSAACVSRGCLPTMCRG